MPTSKRIFMQQEIINYPFDEIDYDDRERSDNFDRSPEEVFLDRPNTSDTNISYVNGHNLPDEDEDEDEDDLVLGDEDDLDDDDLAEDEIDVEVDDEVDPVAGEDDLVLDVDDDLAADDEEEEDDL
jgi:hypothetical protein